MVKGHDIAMGLRAAYLAMHRKTNTYLSSLNMTADQFVLLSILAEKDGITQQELTKQAFSDPNTVRAMLVLLEKKGLVSRKKHSTDGRAKIVNLSSRGRMVCDRINNLIKPLQEALVSPFTTKEIQLLYRMLNSIAENMSDKQT